MEKRDKPEAKRVAKAAIHVSRQHYVCTHICTHINFLMHVRTYGWLGKIFALGEASLSCEPLHAGVPCELRLLMLFEINATANTSPIDKRLSSDDSQIFTLSRK